MQTESTLSIHQATHLGISWKAAQYFNLYRFLIAFLFVSLIWTGQLPDPLGSYNVRLFSLSAHLYLLLAISLIFFINLRSPTYGLQITTQIILDILIISLMMYASNGIGSGFGMLLVIAVIGGSILQGGKIAVLFASVAALIVLAQETYVHFFRDSPAVNYTHAGFLGITFFITAILGQFLANKLKKSEELARQHAVDLENLGLLNEHIVQRMRSGLLVLNEHYQIRLLNKAAENLLGISNQYPDQDIKQSAPELFAYVKDWQQQNGPYVVIYRPPKGYIDVQVSFTRLHPSSVFGSLIFIEDIAHIRQHVQSLKIASLGRMSASIAHEIRNPLAAISHASQLLSESGDLEAEDRHLASMIIEHSNRVNRIIENMGHITKRQASVLEYMNISQWMHNFIAEFIDQKRLQKNHIHIRQGLQTVAVRVDSSQLHQVVWNLSDNALRYSQLRHIPDTPLVEYQWGVGVATDRVYLDIIDHGSGISEQVASQLFEPFFTTDVDGSGLGLYISRELCEANQASLILDKNTPQGCRFRIHFAHIDKYNNLI